MTRPSRRTSRTAARPRCTRRRKRRTHAQRAGSSWRLPRGMHWSALTRAQRRTRRPWRRTRNRRAPLEDRLARHWTSGCRTRRTADRHPRLHWRRSRTQRSFVNRPRSGLRNDHPRHGSCWRRRSRRTRRNGSRWRSACLNPRRLRRCRSRNLCRRWRRRACGRHNHRRRCDRRWSYWRRDHCMRGKRSRRRRSRGPSRRRNYGLRHDWRDHGPADSGWRHDHRRFFRCSMRHSRRRCTRRYYSRSFLLLRYRSQHISGTGNMRQINFCFDFFFAANSARTRLASRRRTFRRGADVHPHLLRFVLFQRAGVRLLLGHPYQRKRIQNGFALYFQLSG